MSSLFNRLSEGNIGQLINNFLSLAFIQITNFILPLVVIPHLILKIGISKFGQVSFGQVLCLYLVIFTEYGFNLSATKEISLNRDNKEKLEEIYNSVMTTRLFLCILGFVFLAALVFIVPQLRKDWIMYLTGSTIMWGQALIPVWFFLGIEKMKFITYLNLISKLFFTALIFIFVQKESDYIYPNLFQGIGSLSAGLICLLIVRNKFGIKFKISNFNSIKEQLRISFFIFVSNFSANIYMNINIVILNFVSTPEIVGMFSIAEKVFVAGKHVISVLFQTIYPYTCKLYNESVENLNLFFIRFQLLTGIGFLISGLLTWIFAGDIIYILSKKDIPYSVTILKLLSFVPFFIVINIPAYQTLLINNFKKSLTISMLAASVINIILNIILGFPYGAFGTVAAIAASELFVLISFNIIVWKRTGITFFRLNQRVFSLKA